MEQLAARWAHNPKVTGSSPVPATTKLRTIINCSKLFFWGLGSDLRSTDYLKKIRKCGPELHSIQGTSCPHLSMKTNGKTRKALAGSEEHMINNEPQNIGVNRS